jgi:NAD-dependent dihydropyrimidine dehydrogenase PreA subunit/nitroreductase
MIIVDERKCGGCGSCMKVCHESCMTLVGKKVAVDHAVCSTCTQCIAICPNQALSWDGAEPLAYDGSRLPSSDQMDELLKERRTVRDFTEAPIAREALEEIASYGIYAPTHNYHFRCVIVDRQDIIELFDREIFRLSQRMYRLIFKPRLMQKLAGLLPAPFKDELVRARPKLEMAGELGRAFRSRPAALVCVVGDRRVPLSLESAQYSLHTMALFAQTKGLGCRNLVGNQMAFNRSREIRKRLRLGKHEKIFAVMGVGQPAVRFRNKVVGKRMKVQWNEGTGSPDRRNASS